jgi:FkbM family methyltransferase
MAILPLNIEASNPLRNPQMFNINILKPHICEDGIILYGAGDNCVKFLTSLFLRNIKANILCVADADKNKHGKSILNVPIVTMEELQKYDKQTLVLITPLKGFREIADNLKDMQFSNLFYYDSIAREYATFIEKYLQKDKDRTYFNFGGALLPDRDEKEFGAFKNVFNDVFYIPLFHGDNYDKSIVDILDLYMSEGPYGLQDDNFDVTVKEGDVVIDAGAWIGDFSAYCANKNAEIYAFEPTPIAFALLEQTVELNKPRKIYPVKKGLSDRTGKATINFCPTNSGGNSVIAHKDGDSEQISLTTLDAFVAENNIKKIDFIKADIEGSERDMLRGATNVLKTFAPKLAICTYHLPDDQRVLEDIILAANPAYKVIHLRRKLFACVVENLSPPPP